MAAYLHRGVWSLLQAGVDIGMEVDFQINRLVLRVLKPYWKVPA